MKSKLAKSRQIFVNLIFILLIVVAQVFNGIEARIPCSKYGQDEDCPPGFKCSDDLDLTCSKI